MKPNRITRLYAAIATLVLFACTITYTAFARVGGAGGHSSGGGHSSSGHSGGGGFVGGGGGGGIPFPLLVIIVIIVLVVVIYSKKKGGGAITGGGEQDNYVPSSKPFPEGLDAQKVSGSFLAIQDAWQKKDLKNVRKWLSDGMYQRLSTQFKMMNVLGQSNTLNNIRISSVVTADTNADSNYETAEVAISFSMDDSFTSSKYPQFNESFSGDTDTEYWTFIKRFGAETEKNLYDNNNCPNCGALFEVKMGEISRCSNCNTLTNSATYDWVLSEITQRADYSGGAGLSSDSSLKELMSNDPFFAVQRMEDIASNIFMQIMETLTIGNKTRITRFADEATTDIVMQMKKATAPFVFDRLYLNNVTLESYAVEGDLVKLYFGINATYRRATVEGKLQMLDGDFVTSAYSIELSRNKNVMAKGTAGETVYSYECSNCGAPYIDTTEDHCTYCDAPVIDIKRNWVLTGFSMG